MPAIIAALVISTGRMRAPRGVDGRRRSRRPPRRRACSANVTSRIAFATATPIAMIAPMNDCTLSVVRVDEQHQHDAGQHRRHRRDDDERQPQRLEVRGEQQEDHDDGHDEAGARCCGTSRASARSGRAR